MLSTNQLNFIFIFVLYYRNDVNNDLKNAHLAISIKINIKFIWLVTFFW